MDTLTVDSKEKLIDESLKKVEGIITDEKNAILTIMKISNLMEEGECRENVVNNCVSLMSSIEKLSGLFETTKKHVVDDMKFWKTYVKRLNTENLGLNIQLESYQRKYEHVISKNVSAQSPVPPKNTNNEIEAQRPNKKKKRAFSVINNIENFTPQPVPVLQYLVFSDDDVTSTLHVFDSFRSLDAENKVSKQKMRYIESKIVEEKKKLQKKRANFQQMRMEKEKEVKKVIVQKEALAATYKQPEIRNEKKRKFWKKISSLKRDIRTLQDSEEQLTNKIRKDIEKLEREHQIEYNKTHVVREKLSLFGDEILLFIKKMKESLGRKTNISNDGSSKNSYPTEDVTLIMTDIASSTSLWEHDINLTAKAMQIHNDCCKDLMDTYNAYEFKSEGDAFLMAFFSPEDAINFALQLQVDLLKCNWPKELDDLKQTQLEYENGDLTAENRGRIIFRGFRVRVSIHCGNDVVIKIDEATKRADYFGPLTNKCCRINTLTSGGEICISDLFYKSIQERMDELDMDFVVTEKGTFQLKGIKENVFIRSIVPKKLEKRMDLFDNKEINSMKVKSVTNLKELEGLNVKTGGSPKSGKSGLNVTLSPYSKMEKMKKRAPSGISNMRKMKIESNSGIRKVQSHGVVLDNGRKRKRPKDRKSRTKSDVDINVDGIQSMEDDFGDKKLRNIAEISKKRKRTFSKGLISSKVVEDERRKRIELIKHACLVYSVIHEKMITAKKISKILRAEKSEADYKFELEGIHESVLEMSDNVKATLSNENTGENNVKYRRESDKMKKILRKCRKRNEHGFRNLIGSLGPIRKKKRKKKNSEPFLPEYKLSDGDVQDIGGSKSMGFREARVISNSRVVRRERKSKSKEKFLSKKHSIGFLPQLKRFGK